MDRPREPAHSAQQTYTTAGWILLAGLLACPWDSAQAQPTGQTAAGATAKQPAPGNADSQPDDRTAVDPVIATMVQREARLRALLDGTLDPTVDPAEVLRFDAVEPGLSLADVSAAIAAAGSRSAAADLPALADPTDALALARRSLQLSLVEYLRLPAARKRALLARQMARKRKHETLTVEVEQLRQTKAQLATRAGRLAEFLDDRLPIEVEPGGLVVIDLAPARPTKPAKPAKGAQAPATALSEQRAQLLAEIESLHARIADQQRIYLAMEPAAQAALLEHHAERRLEAQTGESLAKLEQERQAAMERERTEQAAQARTEAERNAQEADRAQQEALKAAAEAHSEAQRLLAAEKARLLGLQGEMARADAALAEQATRINHRYDAALSFVSRVQELEARSVLDRKKEGDAGALYTELRGKTREYRADLSRALDSLAGDESIVPDVTDRKQPQLLDADPELATLRQRLRTEQEALLRREEQLRWGRAMKLREALTVLNESRLATLPMIPASVRDRVTGFGPDGVAQGTSEAEHMALMVRYNSQAFPVELGKLRDQIGSSTIAIILTLFQIALFVLGFRWWRRHADNILGGFYRATLDAVEPNWITQTLALLLWYLRRVRIPVEWWILCAVIFRYISGIEGLQSVEFVWAIAVWALAGWTAVLLLDAFAARQTMRRSDPEGQPELRMRSLRFVALVIVLNGLVLSLTEQSVGQGTIYAWMTSVAVLLVLPVIALLIYWWRPHIFERIGARKEPGRVLDWVRQRSTGWASFVAAAVGGAYILFEGVARWVARWVSGFEAAERLSAYVFRNQVQKHVSRGSARVRSDLPDADVSSMLPDSEPPSWLEEVEAANLQEVEAMVRTPGSIVAVVGERGLGKTTFLRRLQDRLTTGTRRVRCPRTGFDALLASLGSELGQTTASSTAGIVEALRSTGCSALLIDDVHVLAQPSVGGLVEFDRLLELARQSADSASWVFAVSSHAWSYIERARGLQGIDRVVRLEPWSRAQIALLAQSRAAQAGIAPSFEELVVPRSFDLDDDPADTRLEGGFYRILWDYADGNPAVALHFWRRSIFRRDDGKLVVALFDGPTSAEMDDLPALLPFVLRALAQLEEADADTVARCANLPALDILDLLRLAVRRGYVEEHEGRSSLSAHYYRAVTTLLRRQHLLT